MPGSALRSVIEVRYLSMSRTHLQVEYTDDSGFLEEAWIPLTSIEPDFNIFHDIMDLEVDVSVLDELGIPHG